MIYLDHAATSQPRPEALQAMWPYLTERFGNPSSVHERGAETAEAMEQARSVIAELTGFAANDVVVTSGGTEADNLAIIGLALANPRGRHLVSARTEHEAVLQSLAALHDQHGFEISWLELTSDGTVTPDALRAALRPDSTLLSLMLVNNEVGTVQPIAELAAIAHSIGALVHCDAVQGAGWLPLSDLGVDALSLSGHKVGAPQGVGAAIIRSRLAVHALQLGGGQQRGRRSGTENVPGAVALAAALALAERDRRAGAAERVAILRDRLIDGVLAALPGARLTGPIAPSQRAAQLASFVFERVSGEAMLLELERRGVICSSGSACAAGSTEPSHVLLALGLSPELAHTAVRFSLGLETTEADIEHTIWAVSDAARTLLGS